MRKWVDYYLSKRAKEDPKIRLLIADVGDFPLFTSQHPDKFLNVGVSESNAIGVAAGMASEGLHVYVYGVSSFFLYRAYEQLKYSISYWRMPVTFIGVGFGWKYYNIGLGHFCPDDIGLVQALPHFEIYTPYTLSQLKSELTYVPNNPRYIRITASIIDEELTFPRNDYEYIVLTYGEMTSVSIEVTKSLNEEGYDIGCVSFCRLDNIPPLLGLLSDKCVVIEDQCSQGGLTYILNERGIIPFMKFNLPFFPNAVARTRKELLAKYGLDAISITNRILDRLSL